MNNPIKCVINFSKKQPGFSLIEIMVALAIVAILASIAIPSYTSYVMKSRRSDALEALLSVQHAQERWRADNLSYSANLADIGVCSSCTTSFTSTGGHYSVAISDASSTGFTATATALGGQANDPGCATMTLTVANNASTGTPTSCWQK